MASPTVVRAKGQQRKTNINEEEFAFASPSQNQNGYGATTSRNMSYNGASGKAPEPDVVQSVQRELLMLRHQLSPQKGHRRKGKATVSPQKPAVLFGNDAGAADARFGVSSLSSALEISVASSSCWEPAILSVVVVVETGANFLITMVG